MRNSSVGVYMYHNSINHISLMYQIYDLRTLCCVWVTLPSKIPEKWTSERIAFTAFWCKQIVWKKHAFGNICSSGLSKPCRLHVQLFCIYCLHRGQHSWIRCRLLFDYDVGVSLKAILNSLLVSNLRRTGSRICSKISCILFSMMCHAFLPQTENCLSRSLYRHV
jgi:hypothetical protein